MLVIPTGPVFGLPLRGQTVTIQSTFLGLKFHLEKVVKSSETIERREEF